MGFPQSVLCSGRPIELDKPHILPLVAETGFLLFKEQVALNLKNKISAVQWEWTTSRLIKLTTPVSFRWTVPLNKYPASLSCIIHPVGMNTHQCSPLTHYAFTSPQFTSVMVGSKDALPISA